MRIENNGNVGIGVVDPDAKLEVNGQVKITGGSPGEGKILTSDADGLASWQDNEIGFFAKLISDISPCSFSEVQLSNFSEEFDDGDSFNTTTGEFTVPQNGVYQFTFKIRWGAASTLNDIPTILRIKLNDDTIQQFTHKVNITSSYADDTQVIGIVKANLGDVISFPALYSSGSPVIIKGGITSSSTTNVSGFKIY